jgi:predicted metalloprotease with PDZ domain
MYPLVYSHGMVNGLLLDILMRESTNGMLGVLDLARMLMRKFGPSKPFVDTLLFDEIDSIAPKSVAAYIRRYIGGKERTPIADIVRRIGLTFGEERKRQGQTFGVRGKFSTVEGMPGFITSPEGPNVTGVQQGDRLRSMDGKNLMQANEALWRKLMRPEKQETNTIVVCRGKKDVTLTSTTRIGSVIERNGLKKTPTRQQRNRNCT